LKVRGGQSSNEAIVWGEKKKNLQKFGRGQLEKDLGKRKRFSKFTRVLSLSFQLCEEVQQGEGVDKLHN